jgi:hypothetical protein
MPELAPVTITDRPLSAFTFRSLPLTASALLSDVFAFRLSSWSQ